jgi:rod shape-determining protein MreD
MTLLVPVIFPSLRLMFFAPFLIQVYYKKDYQSSLWWALLAGLVLDCLTFDTRIGLQSLNYVLTTSIIYHQRKNFFEDSMTTLPLMTDMFAIISTLFQVVLEYVFGQGLSISYEWAWTDLILMPLIDALYALTIFEFPFSLFSKKFKIGRRRVKQGYAF